MGLRSRLVAVAAALALAAPVAAVAHEGESHDYAPLDRPGPALSVSPKLLAKSLTCTGSLRRAKLDPVLLVPGTNLDPKANFSWNYVRAFRAQGRPYCTVSLPEWGLVDIQVSGEYLVHAIRTMSRAAGRKVDVLGYSQGGMVPRWALRFWPDTRRMVDDLVGLAPSNHGTYDSVVTCSTGPCHPSHWQQAATSRFVEALNSRAEAFRGVDYTVVYTRYDQIVTPNVDGSGSSINNGERYVVNVALQDVCPTNTAEHLAIGSYDPVAYALAIDALDHRGPADPSRVPVTVCAQPFQPGVDPAGFGQGYGLMLDTIGRSSMEGPKVPAEPALRKYVLAR